MHVPIVFAKCQETDYPVILSCTKYMSENLYEDVVYLCAFFVFNMFVRSRLYTVKNNYFFSAYCNNSKKKKKKILYP